VELSLLLGSGNLRVENYARRAISDFARTRITHRQVAVLVLGRGNSAPQRSPSGLVYYGAPERPVVTLKPFDQSQCRTFRLKPANEMLRVDWEVVTNCWTTRDLSKLTVDELENLDSNSLELERYYRIVAKLF
jgi:hypothetical protein